MTGGKEKFHPLVFRIRKLLDDAGIAYKSFEHEEVRTSEEAAAVRPEYSIEQGAKALIVRIKKRGVPKENEKEFVQVVVPGHAKFDPKKVRDLLNARDIRFATEEEVATVTDGVRPGGVPPFGILFGLRIVVDESIFDNEEMIFNAGDRCYSIALKTSDYRRVVKPLVAQVT